MRIILLIITFILPLSFCSAQTCRNDFKANPYLAGSSYVAYAEPEDTLTAAPSGYEPCYLSHYGRRGSCRQSDIYNKVYSMLLRADRARMLTERGKQLLDDTKQLCDEAALSNGEQTELCADQHRLITERMYNNFPEIFRKPKAHVDTMSIVVSQDDPAINEAKRKVTKILDDFRKLHIYPQRLMESIFAKQTFWKDSIKADKAMSDIFQLAMSVQNTKLRESINLCNLFTEDEIFDLWQCQNAYWYMTYGPSRYSDGIQPYSQRDLLRQIINEADSCLRLDNCGATLRYGHDTTVPLICLLELDNTNKQIADLNTLPTHEWCDYRITPMAGNLQLVFYRAKGTRSGTSIKDSRGNYILVKVLCNEREARLPIPTSTYPYYRWVDVKNYYLKKLDAYEASRKAAKK